MFPRCVTKDGNTVAQRQLWQVFEPVGGEWRGIAHIPDGNLRLREAFAAFDARRRFAIDLDLARGEAPPALASRCICGDIMAGLKSPRDCSLFGERLRARHAGRRLHGQQRGHLPDLAPVRRPSVARGGPVTRGADEHITLKHGAGGRAMRRLIEQVFVAGRRRPSRGHHRPRRARRWRRGADRRRAVAGRDDRLARHPPDLLPGRRHRPARGLGHGQRPRHDGRHRGARADLRRHHGGGVSASRSRADPGVHPRDLRRGRRDDPHRRHEGHGPRRDRRHRAQHDRRGADRRAWSATPACAPATA